MIQNGLALEGLRIVEYGSLVAGPYCAKLLADGGAQVIKVEPPQGEELRRPAYSFAEEEEQSRAGLFQFLNTNKRGVTLDLYTAQGRRLLWRLLAEADIFIWSGPSELGRKLRLHYRDLREANPRLIVTAITPFGLTGPYRNFKSDEFIVYNLGGLGYASPGPPDHTDDPPNEPPLHPRTPIADIITGLVGAGATMMAVFARGQDGKGRQVDVSGMEAVASMVARDISVYSCIREITGRLPKIFALQPNAMFPCKDGWVVVATPYRGHWDRLVELMGSPEWVSLEVFSDDRLRAANFDALRPLIEEWTMQHTGEEIMLMAQSKSIPCFPAFTVGQMVESEHTRARDFLWTVPVEGKPARIPGPPYKLPETPHTLRNGAPELGQHNEDIYGTLLGAGELGNREAARPWGHLTSATDGRSTLTPMPLDGVRVLDLGQVVAAPHCARMLAWMGADVITVESTKRLTTRNSPPYARNRPGLNTSALYNALGPNKRSCTLNLTTPQGLELFKGLVRVSDIVVENFATRTMPKLGLAYDTLRQLNPGIIMLSISGFGRSGPMKDYVAMHSAVNLFSGVATVTGYGPEDKPRILGAIVPDPLSGTAGCLAILEALYYRDRTGRGQHIDLSMSEVFTNLIPEAVVAYSRNGRHQAPLGNRDPYKAPHGVYRCKGPDHWVAISVSTDQQWQAFCTVLGQPELAQNSRFADAASRWRHQDELDTIITWWTRRQTHYKAMHVLQAAGVPAGAATDAKDLLNDPHLRARKRIVQTDHPEAGRHRMLGMPWDVGEVPRLKYRPAPCMGQHTNEVLRELLGISDKEIQQLSAENVLT